MNDPDSDRTMAGPGSGDVQPQGDGQASQEYKQMSYKMPAARAIADPAFFERFRNNPRRAAKEINYHLTDDQLEELKQVDWDALEKQLPELRKALRVNSLAAASW